MSLCLEASLAALPPLRIDAVDALGVFTFVRQSLYALALLPWLTAFGRARVLALTRADYAAPEAMLRRVEVRRRVGLVRDEQPTTRLDRRRAIASSEIRTAASQSETWGRIY